MKNRQVWRDWLQKNHQSVKSVWLVYFKKHTGKLSVQYAEAVEEALCFGWIDGQIKRIDEERYMQRYTPRTSKSKWSMPNIERAEKLIQLGKMTDTGLKVYSNAMKAKMIVPNVKNFSISPDFQAALEKNSFAWYNYRKFSPSVQLSFVYWVSSVKTEAMRQKRIAKALALLEKNEKLGII